MLKFVINTKRTAVGSLTACSSCNRYHLFRNVAYNKKQQSNYSNKYLLVVGGIVTTVSCISYYNYNTNHFITTADNSNTVTNSTYSISDSMAKNKARVPSNFNEFYTELKSVLQSEQIEIDIEECKLHGKPWNSYHKIEDYPLLVIYPNSTEDVSNIARICNKYHIAIVPFGGGTSLEGQTICPSSSISLDFCNMKRVLELNEKDLDVTVQAGLGYVELNDMIRDKGVWFPLDPGPGAAIGGMCACRCSGSTAVRYGSMRENVLGLTAVLADGTIVKTGNRARKSSAGYDLTRLFIGSEGTLAIITEATIKLHGIPKVSYALRIAFPGGIYDAASTARDTLNCGVTIGRCELLDDSMIKIINTSSGGDPEKLWPEKTVLMYEITGLSTTAVEEQVKTVLEIAEKYNGSDIYIATDPKETKEFWRIRKECLWSAMGQYPDREPMITDVCVPLSKLPQLISETKIDIERSKLPGPIIAHAGDGNFHALIFFKPDDPSEVIVAKQLAKTMAEKAIDLGGTCTGEHGVGIGKKELLRKEAGMNSIKLMETIKKSMDPKNIMNPGKVIDISDKKKSAK